MQASNLYSCLLGPLLHLLPLSGGDIHDRIAKGIRGQLHSLIAELGRVSEYICQFPAWEGVATYAVFHPCLLCGGNIGEG